MPDPQTGVNPFWATFGYPGPGAPNAPGPKTVTPLVPEGVQASYEADAVVVGSGAGGGVIAAALAEAGQKVIVLEAGGLFDESDFNGYELWAYQNLYWRGGPSPTADMNVSLYAGSTYGGGTTINWTNCLRTKPWVREQWAREHGVEGLDGPDFDRHLDSVWERLSVGDRCSHLNGTQTLMQDGANKLGWSFKTITRNIDESCYDPATAGFIGFGDKSGAKQSTAKTYLADAVERDADVIVRCVAERVLVEGGRAAGVEAAYVDPESGRRARVTVRAPRVVVACGALESPALLLRSGLGGDAVGKHLRLHPCTAIFAQHNEDTLPALIFLAIWAPVQTGLVDQSVLASPAGVTARFRNGPEICLLTEAKEIARGDREAGFKSGIQTSSRQSMGRPAPATPRSAAGSPSSSHCSARSWRCAASTSISGRAGGVERWLMGLLLGASLIATLTTSASFFAAARNCVSSGWYAPGEFIFGANLEPADRDPRRPGRFVRRVRLVPCSGAPSFIGATIAMIVAISRAHERHLPDPICPPRSGAPDEADPRDPRRRPDAGPRYFAALTVAPIVRASASRSASSRRSRESAPAAGLVMGIMIILCVSSMPTISSRRSRRR